MLTKVKRQSEQGGISAIDPLKYNRGQVIHFAVGESPSKPYQYSVSADGELYKSNVVKNTVCVDWFQATIRITDAYLLEQLNGDEIVQEIAVNDAIMLVSKGHGTEHFVKLYEVYMYGERFGVMQADSRNPVKFSRDRVNIKIDNHHLYSVDWLDNFKYLLSEMLSDVVSISRLDIAIDGGSRPVELLQRSMNGRVVERKGNARLRMVDVAKDNSIQQYVIGSSASDKQAVIYPKGKELAISNKKYISEFWKHNGLQVDGEVYRVELRMNSKVNKSYNWQQLDDAQYLASIMRTELKNYLEFYYVGKDKNKYRAYKNNSMEVINFESMGGVLLEKKRNQPAGDIGRAKETVKNLLREEYLHGLNGVQQVVSQLVDYYTLHEWLGSRHQYWVECDWSKRKRAEAFTAGVLDSAS